MRISLLLGAFCLCASAVFSQKVWQRISLDAVHLPAHIDRDFEPTTYEAFVLDYATLRQALADAPFEETPAARHPLVVDMPTLDGQLEPYALIEIAVLPRNAASRYPDIRTYAGYALREPSRKIRLTLSPEWGLQGMIRRSDKGITYIERLAPGEHAFYRVYDRKAFPQSLRSGLPAILEANPTAIDVPRATVTQPVIQERGLAAPVTVRVYRFAAATTGEFSQDHGGTKASVLAAITGYTNRLNAIYEADLAVRLVLVDDIEKIIFLDPATDPYTGTSVQGWLDQNPLAILNALGGQEKYDIGHVFARFLGGSAIGVGASSSVCTSLKGRGCSAGRQGIYGDEFFSIVGQEIGHQWGGGHTWAYCGDNGGINPEEACEPGSGSTIMSYAGSCGTDNVQNNADLYYNICSIIKIRRFIDRGSGSTCGTLITTTNNAPEINLPYRNNFFIPIRTPFELNAAATDPDGDALTYCWEQLDPVGFVRLGQASGNSPLFRSFPPTRATNRVFPRLSTIIANASDRTELLPTYDRKLTFGLTVRDNRTGGGGIAFDTLVFRATAQAGPFLVNSPNTAVTWETGKYETITWDVANTNGPLVNCQRVHIRLSTDGGLTYPITLASNVPNNGRACVAVPNVTTDRARVRVEAADNVFFDISNTNFTVKAPTTAGFSVCAAALSGDVCLPADYSVKVNSNSVLGFGGSINWRVANLPAGATATFSPSTTAATGETTLTLRFAPNTPEGVHTLLIEGSSGGTTSSVSTVITVTQNDLSGIGVRSPVHGAQGVSVDNGIVRWQGDPDADSYDVQIATDPTFSEAAIKATSSNVIADSVRVGVALEKGTIYYWRVRGKNPCGSSAWVGPFVFVTAADVCNTYSATDLPKNITANTATTIESQIAVPSGGAVTDVNVLEVRGRHDFLSELEVRLIPPSGGTGVLLFRNRCTTTGNFNIGFDDAASGTFGCPPPNTGAISKSAELLSTLRGVTAAGNWTLRVIDNRAGSGGQLQGFRLELCAAGAPTAGPMLVTNNPLNIVPNGNGGIDAALLKVEDANTAADKLVYTLLNIPQFGRLELNGKALVVGDRFTQADVNNGSLRFFDNGQNRSGLDTFRFSVTDGEGGLAAGTFRILQPVSAKEALQPLPFSMAPNPATERVHLTFGESLRSTTYITLTEPTGRQVRLWTVSAGNVAFEVPINDLPTGVYVCTVRNAHALSSQSIVVQRL